jgi:hypothetical protein
MCKNDAKQAAVPAVEVAEDRREQRSTFSAS